jgi:hypothetical protein
MCIDVKGYISMYHPEAHVFCSDDRPMWHDCVQIFVMLAVVAKCSWTRHLSFTPHLTNCIHLCVCVLPADVSDAGSGGQVLLDAATFSKIKEELAPLGVVDANGIDYAQLEAARPFSLWQAMCGGRRGDRMGGGAR